METQKKIRPYLFISLCGLLAFAPVSFMIRALKNDIVALEYPINHFISQSIRHGQVPAWFNTWGMGFPLESNLTWGIFSTPQVVFSSVFNYDIYALHIEFMFFILLAGWSMFYLLKRFFKTDETISVLLSIAWMLSGFMVGSTQWMLYVSAAAFIPLFIISLLSLLENPSWRRSLQAAISFTMMFTSVYAAFNIITVYSTVVFLLLYFLRKQEDKKLLLKRLKFLLVAAIIIGVFCLPCLYLTFKLLQNISRGQGITGTAFFDSNYLHPGALSSMLFPFSSVRMQYPNTEGTMLNTYAGILVLISLPLTILTAIRQKNKRSWIFFAAAILFLLTAFGSFTPIRNALNFLPGFSYFRNPALFRLYFLLMLILFLANILRSFSFQDLLTDKSTRIALFVLSGISLFGIGWKFQSANTISGNDLSSFIKDLRYEAALFISAILQTVLMGTLLLAVYFKKLKLAKWVIAGDLILNTLICTPFFSVSSYTLPEVNNILINDPRYQQINPTAVTATYKDPKGNEWHNINVFNNLISAYDSYKGPLVLKNSISGTKEVMWKSIVFARDDSAADITIVKLTPNHVRVKAILNKQTPISLLQNYYPGWRAYINDKRSPIIFCFGAKGQTTPTLGVSTLASKGEWIIDFKYRHNGFWIWALIVHLIIISYCLWRMAKSFIILSSSLSSQPE